MRWQEKEREEALEESLERFLRDIAARYGSTLCEPGPMSAASGCTPPVTLLDTGATFVLRAELPGVAPERIKVTTGPSTVTIEGVWGAPPASDDGVFLIQERCEGAFRRTIDLPSTVAGDLAVAVLENGILEIELPKHDDAGSDLHDVKLS